jgi:hypothetical protein
MQGGKGAGLGQCHRHGRNTEVSGADKAQDVKSRLNTMKDERPGKGLGFWGCRRDVEASPDVTNENIGAGKGTGDNQDKKPTDA